MKIGVSKSFIGHSELRTKQAETEDPCGCFFREMTMFFFSVCWVTGKTYWIETNVTIIFTCVLCSFYFVVLLLKMSHHPSFKDNNIS